MLAWPMNVESALALTPAAIISEGMATQVVTVVRDGGRLKGSDAEVWNRFFHVWAFRSGKVLRLSVHTDRDRALEAAGLRE